MHHAEAEVDVADAEEDLVEHGGRRLSQEHLLGDAGADAVAGVKDGGEHV